MKLLYSLSLIIGLCNIENVLGFSAKSPRVHENVIFIHHTEACDYSFPFEKYLFEKSLLDYTSEVNLRTALSVGEHLVAYARNDDYSEALTGSDKITVFRDIPRIKRRDKIIAALTLLFYQKRQNESSVDQKNHKIYSPNIGFHPEKFVDIIDTDLLPDNMIIEFLQQMPCIQILPSSAEEHFEQMYILSNDPMLLESSNYPQGQWHLGGRGVINLNNDFGAKVVQAWTLFRGERLSERIAIVGSGCYNHPDLQENFVNQNFFNIGHDFVTGRLNPYREPMNAPSGTAAAGMIAATTNNDYGGAGICWTCKITCLKVYDDEGTFSRAALLQALTHLLTTNIRLVLLKYTSFEYSIEEADLLQQLVKRGVLFVAPAGNHRCDLEAAEPVFKNACKNISGDVVHDVYPASYGIKGILVVGASASDGSMTKFSNYGRSTVHLMAPGTDLLLPSRALGAAGGYQRFKGTEYAAALVAGVAGLMWSSNTTLTASDIQNILLNTVQLSEHLTNKCVSGGIIDAFLAVKHSLKEAENKEIKKYPYPALNQTTNDVDVIIQSASSTLKSKLWMFFATVTLFYLYDGSLMIN